MCNAEYCFSEKFAFPKCSFSEKVDAGQKYLRRKVNSSVVIFTLNNSSAKKIDLHAILKKWLLCRSFALKKKLFRKGNCCEKVTVLKQEILKKKAILKK